MLLLQVVNFGNPSALDTFCVIFLIVRCLFGRVLSTYLGRYFNKHTLGSKVHRFAPAEKPKCHENRPDAGIAEENKETKCHQKGPHAANHNVSITPDVLVCQRPRLFFGHRTQRSPSSGMISERFSRGCGRFGMTDLDHTRGEGKEGKQMKSHGDSWELHLRGRWIIN